MKTKTKLVAYLMSVCLVLSFAVIGILAVTSLNMKIGGDINFFAEGVSFSVGEGKFYEENGTTLYTGITSQTGILQGFSMDTDTKLTDVSDELATWTGLDLQLDSRGDAILKFNVANNMDDKELYILFTVTHGDNLNNNMKIVASTSEKISANANKDITIKFDILDMNINAGLEDFEIGLAFSEPPAVNASGTLTNNSNTKFTPIKYNVNTTTKTASIVLQPDQSVSGELIIFDKVYVDGQEYIVKSIEDDAFNSQFGITSVIIPDTVETIGEAAFYDCGDIDFIHLGNGLKTIKFRAFEGTCITSITIPKSIQKIEEGIFAYCNELEEVILEPGIQGYELQNNGLVETTTNTLLWGNEYTTIANGITRIGAYAFAECTEIEYMDLPTSLVEIGEGAFADSGICEIEFTQNITKLEAYAFCATKNLFSVVIPTNIKYLGQGCFQYCDNLNDIYMRSSTPPTIDNTEDVFDKEERVKIYVPNGSINTYKSNTQWSYYSDILFAI